MIHRHLNHSDLTLAAIEDTLSRGSLPDWAPIIRAIESEPFGDVAAKTLRICAAREIYGSSKIFTRLIRSARRNCSSGDDSVTA